ncbi:hypothetical protein M501DRAFT_1020065 [Patellaria atrata CBS 101060]|uniref:Uncharacterized protein n=1 Tax=Patellaria atrata CBS 101060 TaxID=1346257 RepID=A0A9P4S5B1_9PEZI|nr:hypothetical protein M501DRAFT_1020065 [Patellaria atrata CBS 101060]
MSETTPSSARTVIWQPPSPQNRSSRQFSHGHFMNYIEPASGSSSKNGEDHEEMTDITTSNHTIQNEQAQQCTAGASEAGSENGESRPTSMEITAADSRRSTSASTPSKVRNVFVMDRTTKQFTNLQVYNRTVDRETGAEVYTKRAIDEKFKNGKTGPDPHIVLDGRPQPYKVNQPALDMNKFTAMKMRGDQKMFLA